MMNNSVDRVAAGSVAGGDSKVDDHKIIDKFLNFNFKRKHVDAGKFI